MVTTVKRYKLSLPYVGGFATCTPPLPPYPPFSGSNQVVNSNDLTIIKPDVGQNWRKIIREGGNASTNLTAYGSELVKWVPAYYSWNSSCRVSCDSQKLLKTNKGSQWVYGNVCTTVQFNSSDPQNLNSSYAENLAKERFLNNVLEKQTRFKGGVFLGELSKTLRMIRSPAKKLFESIVETTASLRKRGKLLPKEKRREFLGNTYLEAAFGWQPLYNDVLNGAEALAEYNLRRGQSNVYVKGSSGPVESLISDTTTSDPLKYGLTTLKFRTREVKKSVVTAKFYGKLLAEPIDSVFLHQRFFGVNLSSFVPTAWELMPYSFLIDYFSNIGRVINAWSVQTASINWVTKTVHKAYLNSYYSSKDEAYINVQVSTCKGRVGHSVNEEVHLKKFHLVRQANALGDILTPPDITFHIPGMGLKWLNMAALAKVKFTKPFF